MTRTAAPSPPAAAAARQAAGRGLEDFGPGGVAPLGGAALPALVAETDPLEGPVYIPGEDALYFTTLPRADGTPAPGALHAAFKRLALDGLNFPVHPSRLSVLPAPVHMPNGMTLGHDGS